MSDKKPWGDDYVPDDRPWTFRPNALPTSEEVTPEMIEAGVAAWHDIGSALLDDEVKAVYLAMRALAKPDEDQAND